MRRSVRHVLPMGIVLLLNLAVQGQKKELTDEQYIRNNFKGITNTLPSVVKWIDDSHFILRRDGKNYEVDAKNGDEKEYVEANINKGSIATTPEIVTKGNDLYLRKNVGDIQLTFDSAQEINQTLSPDGNYIAYTKKNDLYTINLNTKKETRLTKDGSETILNGYASWVYMEEILGRRGRNRAFWWSPDSKRIAFFRSDDSRVPLFTITDAPGLHGVVETQRYPKVGDPNPEVKVGIVEPEGISIVWAAFNEKDDQYFGQPYWKPDGSSLLVQWMNRLQNNLIIYEVNNFTGAKTEFYNEKQKSWIDLDDQGERIQFLKQNAGFILNSDASGWNHLYLHDMKGKLVNAITSGKFTVTNINFVDEDKGVVYFTARTLENSARNDFYRININGKNMERLTLGDYNNNINLSPGGSYFVTTYNNTGTPTRMTLMSTKRKIIKDLGDSKGEEFNNYNMAKTEIIRVKSDDGLYDLPMKVTWPLNMDKNKKYPVLVSVYGGPNAGTVMDTWGLNGNQQWYAKEGLIQVSMDHRASGHFGKEGVANMYHNLGYWEMKDYSTMVKWLIANGGADASKICITGFSYGGYMTCYALTYASDVFTHGMAGGSVTDWNLYDSHYTERFMGTPANNAEGYKNSSVMTHADKYKGMIQIVHGMIDDNVHMQNSIQFISKLQDLKKDFEFMPYSGGRHGWGGAKGVHFQNLKTKFIYKYLLEKEVPKAMLK
ncbi:MAG TPA: DPP IV N-terminal domain-containing protein [Ferruginibacter sp.]|nr:DPP IV N-terminal domain-containing protein [Ferruginibacter sp.]